MAADLVEVGSVFSTNNNGGGSAPYVPSGVQLGDLLIAFFGNNRGQTHSASGWTALSNNGRGAVLWKIATSTEVAAAGSQINFGSQAIGQSASAVMIRVTGFDPADPIPAATVFQGSTGSPGSITPAGGIADLLLATQGGNNDTAGAYSWSNTVSNSNFAFINEGGGDDCFLTADQARGDGSVAVSCSFPNTSASTEQSLFFRVKAAPAGFVPRVVMMN